MIAQDADLTTDMLADAERRAALERLLTQGDLVIDVGANRGQFAQEVLGIQDVSIICFEPVADAFDVLRSLAIHNRQITAENMAISDVTGTADFYIQKSDVGSSLLEPVKNQSSEWLTSKHLIRVNTIRLDEYLSDRGISNISLLKSDAQGFDRRVVSSAGAFLTPQHIGSVLVEVNFHDFYEGQDSFSATVEMMSGAGYFVAGFYRHFNRAGWLWWADVLFLPNVAPFSTNRLQSSESSRFEPLMS